MDQPSPVTTDTRNDGRPVFISYATTDRSEALRICTAIERRGTKCWISTRDVPPGENYQEAIVRALREARAMVLVFSAAANHSDEIKKELSLASRFHVPVIALRIEEVEPSDAFAYELSTRQWIDAFEGGDGSIDLIVGHLAQVLGGKADPVVPARPRPRRSAVRRAIAATGLFALVAAAGTWWWLRPAPATAHSLAVRMAGFETLSGGLPPNLRETVSAEIAAAFTADGVIGVSLAPTPAPGTTPAYALGGTISRDGGTVRVISQLSDERSGVSLWSDTFDYAEDEVANIPRHVAVDAGNVVRCGLFGASTYPKPFPDALLRDYLQFCRAHWDPALADGRKGLLPAQRVVAAAPDFSWGWAAVAAAYWKVAMNADEPRAAERARASGRDAADRAIAIDPANSEALWIKSLLVDRLAWSERESLLKRAVGARRLDCGCEHHQYGEMLASVGRTAEAVEQLRQANDMLALYVYTPLSLAESLVQAGKPAEAQRYYEAAMDLAPNVGFARSLAVLAGMADGEVAPLLDPEAPMPPERRAALVQGYRALATGDAAARASAVNALVSLPPAQHNALVARLLGELGAHHEALAMAGFLTKSDRASLGLLWYPGMRGALRDPGFPKLAHELGLMRYWRAAKVKPDACGEKSAPPFCRMI